MRPFTGIVESLARCARDYRRRNRHAQRVSCGPIAAHTAELLGHRSPPVGASSRNPVGLWPWDGGRRALGGRDAHTRASIGLATQCEWRIQDPHLPDVRADAAPQDELQQVLANACAACNRHCRSLSAILADDRERRTHFRRRHFFQVTANAAKVMPHGL